MRGGRLPLLAPHDASPSSDPSPSTPSRRPPASATGCSAAPPCTSRSPRRSSPRRASSGRSATTSARRSTRVLHDARRASPTTSSTSPAARRSSGPAATSATSTSATRCRPTSTCSSTSSRSSRTPRAAADVLFLANIQPDLQREVREQCDGRALRRAGLDEPVDRHRARRRSCARSRCVDCLILNDGELKQLTDEPNLVARGARGRSTMGPRVVVAKQGEYGAAMFTRDGFFGLPGLPDARTWSTRPARATRSRAASWATSPRTPARRSTDELLRARDGLRHRAGLLQRRGVRHRAHATTSTPGEIAARVAELQRA